MINSKEGHDVVFRLISNDENLNKILGIQESLQVQSRYQDIYANSSLILFRTIEKEVPIHKRFNPKLFSPGSNQK